MPRIKGQFHEAKLCMCFLSTWDETYAQPKTSRKVSKILPSGVPMNFCLMKLTPGGEGFRRYAASLVPKFPLPTLPQV